RSTFFQNLMARSDKVRAIFSGMRAVDFAVRIDVGRPAWFGVICAGRERGMYLTAKRDASSDAQAHLLRVLNGQGLPEAGQSHTGVDPATLAYTAQRREAVAQRYPSIPQMLGSRFSSLFAAYAARESAPQGDVERDMRGFVRQLRIKGRMPDRLTVTLL